MAILDSIAAAVIPLSNCKRRSLLLAGILLLVGGLVFDRFEEVLWVGSGQLEVEFAITDADSGRPIAGASVNAFNPESGIRGRKCDEPFFGITDENGMARKTCEDCTTTGRSSGLRWTDTASICLPSWAFTVSADGYQSTEARGIGEISRHPHKLGPRHYRLVVPVSLHKNR